MPNCCELSEILEEVNASIISNPDTLAFEFKFKSYTINKIQSKAPHGFTPYCLWDGGSSNDELIGIISDLIEQRGRWSKSTSMKRYLRSQILKSIMTLLKTTVRGWWEIFSREIQNIFICKSLSSEFSLLRINWIMKSLRWTRPYYSQTSPA